MLTRSIHLDAPFSRHSIRDTLRVRNCTNSNLSRGGAVPANRTDWHARVAVELILITCGLIARNEFNPARAVGTRCRDRSGIESSLERRDLKR